jgi:pyruvate formate lyase activating enzyme
VDVGNELILDNLNKLFAAGANIWIRIPIIPDVNDNEEHMRGIADISNELERVICAELEPYHDYGISKYEALDKTPHVFPLPDKESIERLADIIKQSTAKPVKIL